MEVVDSWDIYESSKAGRAKDSKASRGQSDPLPALPVIKSRKTPFATGTKQTSFGDNPPPTSPTDEAVRGRTEYERVPSFSSQGSSLPRVDNAIQRRPLPAPPSSTPPPPQMQSPPPLMPKVTRGDRRQDELDDMGTKSVPQRSMDTRKHESIYDADQGRSKDMQHAESGNIDQSPAIRALQAYASKYEGGVKYY
jgi:hypothetical protein